MEAHRLAIAGSFIVLSACAHAPSPSARADLMAVGERMLPLACPTDSTVVERKVANRHQPEVTDSIKAISCEGVEMEIYVGKLASDPRGLPIYLEIRKPNAGLPVFMNVGETVDGLLAALGQPSNQTDRAITYYTGESEDTVTFSVQDQRLLSVRWDWYID